MSKELRCKYAQFQNGYFCCQHRFESQSDIKLPLFLCPEDALRDEDGGRICYETILEEE